MSIESNSEADTKVIPLPKNIEFVFDLSESDIPVTINTPIIQTYPNYLSLTNDTAFFDEVNNKIETLHEILHLQNGIGEILSFVTDLQGRIFQIDLPHVSGVYT